jgi:hypothetical protein
VFQQGSHRPEKWRIGFDDRDIGPVSEQSHCDRASQVRSQTDRAPEQTPFCKAPIVDPDDMDPRMFLESPPTAGSGADEIGLARDHRNLMVTGQVGTKFRQELARGFDVGPIGTVEE